MSPFLLCNIHFLLLPPGFGIIRDISDPKTKLR